MTTSRAPGRQSEGDIRNSQHGAHERNFLLDQADAFDRLHRAANVILVAGGAGKDQRIENDIFGVNAEFSGQQVVGALARFPVCARRVNAWACTGSSSMQPTTTAAPYERASGQMRSNFSSPSSRLIELMMLFALAVGERQFHAARVGGIDHDRRFDFADQLLVKGRNILQLFAIRALQANVDDVRAAFYLASRDFGSFFPLLGRDQILEERATRSRWCVRRRSAVACFLPLRSIRCRNTPRDDSARRDGAAFSPPPFARWREYVFQWCRSIRRPCSAIRDRRNARAARTAIVGVSPYRPSSLGSPALG